MEKECRYHPGTQAVFICEKYKSYLCDKCVSCRDPKLYCKFRPMCLINSKEKMEKM
jgi:hypothetical protein